MPRAHSRSNGRMMSRDRAIRANSLSGLLAQGSRALADAKSSQRRVPAWAGMAVNALCLIYFAGLAALWLLLRFAGDRWWPVTPILYGPKWIWGMPMLLLVPAAAIARSRISSVAIIASVFVAGSVMGVRVHWPWHGAPRQNEIRVLTANVDGKAQTGDGLMDIMSRENVDIVALQESPANHPIALMKLADWDVRATGEEVIASRFPIRHVETLKNAEGWRTVMLRCDVDTPAGILHVFDIHLDTPRWEIDAFMFHSRQTPRDMREGLAARRELAEKVAREIAKVPGPHLLMGDFNLVQESAIFRDNFGDYTDAFDACGVGMGNTKMQRLWGARIDHVLVRDGPVPIWCAVQPDVGSDHLPFLAAISLR
jgi:vancomycin resistance protein VanJ